MLSVSREKDYGVKAFAATNRIFGEPDVKYSLGRLFAKRIENGFAIYSDECTAIVPVVFSSTKVRRCDKCRAKQQSGRRFIGRQHRPIYVSPGINTPIRYIIRDRRSSA